MEQVTVSKKRFRLNPHHIVKVKAITHLIMLYFLALFIYSTLMGGFGADPIKGMEHFTGKAALNTLFITLLISPLSRWLKQSALMTLRRLFGLYSFFWALLHVLLYISLDLGFDWALVGQEIIQRPYLAVGAVSSVILLLLTLTSTQKSQRILGRRWQKLHNWVYLALLLSPIHYWWSVKSDIAEPLLYLLAAFLLLVMRKDKWQRGWRSIRKTNK